MSKTTPTSGKSVIFFGSGPVAARSLQLLMQYQPIEAVITKPTTLAQMSTIAPDTPIYAVSNKRELDALIATTPFTSQLGILIDFGIIVSQAVIDSFAHGIINSHFSILPEWRGADPINFAILSGQPTTGVSLMILTAGMDEGPLVAFEALSLTGTETSEQLTETLIQLSDRLLKDSLPAYHTNPTAGLPQSVTNRTLSYSRKLTKADGIIDWSKSATVIEREIRAFHEWPKSKTTLAEKDVIITSAHVVEKTGVPGTVFIEDKRLGVYCGEDALMIDTLKPAGKKEMPADAFIAGYRAKLIK